MWIAPLVFAVLIIIGAIVHTLNHNQDSLPEEVIVDVLKTEGIDVDYSEFGPKPKTDEKAQPDNKEALNEQTKNS